MHETTLTLLDSYCERAGNTGAFAEPLNAVTNLLFIAAALFAGRVLLKQKDHSFRRAGDLWALLVALFSIGIGSTLWHMYATKHTMWADVLPITVFINIFLISAQRRLLKYDWIMTAGLWGIYFAAGIAAQVYISATALNGTIMYVPTYAALLVLTAAIYMKDFKTGIDFIAVVIVWSLSLIFRTVDLIACPMFPIGTHFLWHILNAWVIWRLLMLLMLRGKRAR